MEGRKVWKLSFSIEISKTFLKKLQKMTNDDDLKKFFQTSKQWNILVVSDHLRFYQRPWFGSLNSKKLLWAFVELLTGKLTYITLFRLTVVKIKSKHTAWENSVDSFLKSKNEIKRKFGFHFTQRVEAKIKKFCH
jgi:hypothetical protein